MIIKVIKYWFQLASWKQILIGLFTGIATGLFFGKQAMILAPIGQMFIHAIQMLVAPVVVTAIVCAVISLEDFSRMRRIVVKALFIYGCCMAISASLGILVANALHVGYGLKINQVITAAMPTQALKISDALVAFVPASPVAALASNNVMQILCFSLLFGIALRLVDQEAKPIKEFFLSLSKVVFQFCKIIIGFAPYGIFALIACVFGQYGLAAVLPLLKFIFAVYLACFLLILIVYGGVLLLQKISPRFFFAGILSALVTAYTTSSSAATLPVTMRCAKENLKIDRTVADFLLPLGTSLNLNGLSIYLSIAAIFAAHLSGMQLGMYQYVSLVIAIVLTAAGAAAVPGSALIVMGAIMNAVGIPLTALPLIAGVDRFNDMAQTMTNVTGDLFATTLVAKSEDLINESP